jgi:hypothetical protein
MTPDELRALVSAMRELGVIQADGVILGPVPTKAVDLERLAKAQSDPKARLAFEQEAAAERLREAKAAWLDETRELLAANGESYTDDQLERMRPFPG